MEGQGLGCSDDTRSVNKLKKRTILVRFCH